MTSYRSAACRCNRIAWEWWTRLAAREPLPHCKYIYSIENFIVGDYLSIKGIRLFP